MNPLSPLGDGPVPPLAPAATVRARGEQRRRRSRTALAEAGVVAVVLAFAGGAAVVGGDRRDVVSTPGASQAPSPAYDENGCQVLVPDEPGGVVPAVCIPSPAPTPRPVAKAAGVDAAALLTPADVATALGGDRWSQQQPDAEDAFPRVFACADGAGLAARAGLVRTIDGLDPEKAVLTQVLAFDDEASATAALAALTDADRCPERPVDSEDGTATVSTQVVQRGPTRVVGWLVLRECPGCQVSEGFSYSRVGTRLVMVRGGGEGVARLATAAEARLRGEAPRTVPPADDDALLTPADAARVEPGDWLVLGELDGSPLLDPCDTDVFSEALGTGLLGRSSVELQVLREAGGTTVSQQLLRFDQVAKAGAAFDDLERQVGQCPRRDEVDGAVTHELVDRGADGLLVRQACGECVGPYVYFAVVQDGTLLLVTRVTEGEDGDPGLERARPYFQAARDRL